MTIVLTKKALSELQFRDGICYSLVLFSCSFSLRLVVFVLTFDKLKLCTIEYCLKKVNPCFFKGIFLADWAEVRIISPLELFQQTA